MTPQEANALLTFARGHDHLVVDTPEQAQTWAQSLDHVPIGAGRLIVQDYYGKNADPQNRKPIDASFIRRLYSTKARELESRHRALNPPPKKRGNGPPPHVAQKFAEFKARQGFKSQIGEQA